MSVGATHKSLRKAIGAIKDTTTVSLAEVNSDYKAVKVNPKELNPYLKDNGSDCPEDAGEKAGRSEFLSSSLVGDGGASWRLKALKRVREQAAQEGRNFDEVIKECWGPVGQLAISAVSHQAAPPRAHLDAKRNRRKCEAEELQGDKQSERDVEKRTDRHHLQIRSRQHSEMRAPKTRDSLSWRMQTPPNMSAEDAGLISAGVSSINKFSNDGSFMGEFLHKQSNDNGKFGSDASQNKSGMPNVVSLDMRGSSEATASSMEQLSANQLAAKALQLCMKGKTEEAEKFLLEAENIKATLDAGGNSSRKHDTGKPSRHGFQDVYLRRDEGNADMHLAQSIIWNRQYCTKDQADDEYDFEGGLSRKSLKKEGSSDQNVFRQNNLVQRIMTQQERCLFCFENPSRPKHLVVSIANFTCLMLPQWPSVVAGHCCILPMQHESATRNVDNNLWDEIRNFKKCLIMMFDKQDKELVFLETVMGLAQQRRHCLIECIPLPRGTAKQAPLYFKKAIDEAEDEWSQHNAKKLIDTSENGLRGSIPKNFPYFHVEFGLDRGFVHVIDDEKRFKGSFGLNVLRGMLGLPEGDMHRQRRHESVEAQKQAVTSFAQDWEPFDWTKQLD